MFRDTEPLSDFTLRDTLDAPEFEYFTAAVRQGFDQAPDAVQFQTCCNAAFRPRVLVRKRQGFHFGHAVDPDDPFAPNSVEQHGSRGCEKIRATILDMRN